MAPKRGAGKEVATFKMEGPSPPLVIKRPIAGRDFSLLVRVFFISLFGANFWLFHDESRTIHCDLVISGSSSPLIFFGDFLGDLIPINFSTENLGTK